MNNILFKKIESTSKEVMEKLVVLSNKTIEKGNETELAEKNGTFRFKITHESIDRHGDTILFDAWDTKFFKKNPVVLWSHKHDSIVGRATEIISAPEEKAYYMEGIWASHADAQEKREMYDEGFVFACSVGFIPEEYDKNSEGGYIIKKAQLLEVSVVAVPAHPEALTTLAQKGFDITDLINKGMLTLKSEDTEEETEKTKDIIEEEVIEEVTETKESEIEEIEESEEETKEEKVKRVLSSIDGEKLAEVLNVIKDIHGDVVDTEEESEEEVIDEETTEETEEEKQLKNKKFLQSLATVVGEVLHEMKASK